MQSLVAECPAAACSGDGDTHTGVVSALLGQEGASSLWVGSRGRGAGLLQRKRALLGRLPPSSLTPSIFLTQQGWATTEPGDSPSFSPASRAGPTAQRQAPSPGGHQPTRLQTASRAGQVGTRDAGVASTVASGSDWPQRGHADGPVRHVSFPGPDGPPAPTRLSPVLRGLCLVPQGEGHPGGIERDAAELTVRPGGDIARCQAQRHVWNESSRACHPSWGFTDAFPA